MLLKSDAARIYFISTVNGGFLMSSHQNPKPHSPPHSDIYKSLLRAGARLNPLKQVHAQIIHSGSHNRSILIKLITFVSAVGDIAYTRLVYLSIPSPVSFLFNTAVTTPSKNGFPKHAIFFYCRMMVAKVEQCNYSFTAVIKACVDLGALRYGRIVHCHALGCGYGFYKFVQCGLFGFYCKCGDLFVARKVFDEMPERTVIRWNSMISGYEKNGLGNESIKVFFEMDSATFVVVLSA